MAYLHELFCQASLAVERHAASIEDITEFLTNPQPFKFIDEEPSSTTGLKNLKSGLTRNFRTTTR